MTYYEGAKEASASPPWASTSAKDNPNTSLPILLGMLQDILVSSENEACRLERNVDRLAMPDPSNNKLNQTMPSVDSQNLSVTLSRMIDGFREAQGRISRCNSRLQEFIGE